MTRCRLAAATCVPVDMNRKEDGERDGADRERGRDGGQGGAR